MTDSCIIYGMQRAGNHLVMSLLKMLGMKEHPNTIKVSRDNIKNMPLKGHYCFSSHQPYIPNSELLKKYKGIYISRDLRDVAVSQALRFFKDINKLPTVLESIKLRFELVQDWGNHPNVYHTTFEKLVGIHGGGDSTSQKQEVINICNHLNIKSQSLKDFFGNNEFFHKGQIGSYKKHFSPIHLKMFKRWSNEKKR